jgi:hypothetical protein
MQFALYNIHSTILFGKATQSVAWKKETASHSRLCPQGDTGAFRFLYILATSGVVPRTTKRDDDDSVRLIQTLVLYRVRYYQVLIMTTGLGKTI